MTKLKDKGWDEGFKKAMLDRAMWELKLEEFEMGTLPAEDIIAGIEEELIKERKKAKTEGRKDVVKWLYKNGARNMARLYVSTTKGGEK